MVERERDRETHCRRIRDVPSHFPRGEYPQNRDANRGLALLLLLLPVVIVVVERISCSFVSTTNRSRTSFLRGTLYIPYTQPGELTVLGSGEVTDSAAICRRRRRVVVVVLLFYAIPNFHEYRASPADRPWRPRLAIFISLLLSSSFSFARFLFLFFRRGCLTAFYVSTRAVRSRLSQERDRSRRLDRQSLRFPKLVAPNARCPRIFFEEFLAQVSNT